MTHTLHSFVSAMCQTHKYNKDRKRALYLYCWEWYSASRIFLLASPVQTPGFQRRSDKCFHMTLIYLYLQHWPSLKPLSGQHQQSSNSRSPSKQIAKRYSCRMIMISIAEECNSKSMGHSQNMVTNPSLDFWVMENVSNSQETPYHFITYKFKNNIRCLNKAVSPRTPILCHLQ